MSRHHGEMNMIEYENTEELLLNIDKFLSKQKQEYFAVIRYGKHLEFKHYLDNLHSYNNGDVLHMAILKTRVVVDIFLNGHIHTIRIWKDEEEDLYNDIQNRFLKLWKQYRRHEMINGGL